MMNPNNDKDILIALLVVDDDSLYNRPNNVEGIMKVVIIIDVAPVNPSKKGSKFIAKYDSNTANMKTIVLYALC